MELFSTETMPKFEKFTEFLLSGHALVTLNTYSAYMKLLMS